MKKRLAFVIVCTLAACSPPNIASSNGTAACTDYAYAHCSRVAACSPTAMAFRYPNVGTCKSLILANCLAAVAAPSHGATPAFEESCSLTTSSTTWSCDDFLYDQNAPPGCVTPTGSEANGAACAFDSQCVTGFCAIAPGNACGTCAAPPQPGDSCAQLATCAATQVCEPTTMQCVPFATLSQPCSASQPCAVGLGCANGTCQTESETMGSACPASGAGCDFYQGLTCNTESSTCVAEQLVASGQPCGFIDSQNVNCSAGAMCLDGLCVAASPVGQPCDLVAGPVCILPSHCIVTAGTADGGTTGTCQIYDATQCSN
jgi:hypothetical protein